MATILICDEHQQQGYPPTIEGMPLAAFDIPGALSAALAVEVPQPGGTPRTHLDCHDCRWASDPAVEKALVDSVGNPTPRDTVLIVPRASPLGRVWDNPEDAETHEGTVGDPTAKHASVSDTLFIGPMPATLEAGELPVYLYKDPRLDTKVVNRRKKEKKMAKDGAPKKRNRAKPITRKFSDNVTATFAVSGTLTDFLMLSDEAQDDIAALVEKMGTPKGD